MATDAGTLMAGRYRKLGPIGVGGMARVFLAEDERLSRRVAIKQLHAESPDEAAERFDREAKLGASLNHPNLVSIYDVATDSESVLIVMEYVDGKTLKDAIDAGPLDLAKVVSIIHDVAAALNHAHAHGIVHRDVKPANILLRSDGMTKLADLGIATAAESTSITRSGMVLGTASYMAPEQLDGQKAGPASDIYSLAAVAFEAVSGRKAMTGETPMEIAHRVISSPPPDLREAWPDAPEAAAAAISRGMSRDPADRPASAGAFATALHRGLRGAKGVAAVTPPAGAAAAAAAAGAEPAAAAAPSAPRADLHEEEAPEAELAGAATPASSRPPERPPAASLPDTATRRDSGGAPPASPPARPSTYHPSRRKPSWLPAAGAVAALCVIAIVAFSVFGGGGDDDDGKTAGTADKASQSDGGTADGKGDSAKADGNDDGGSSSGGASGAGTSSGSASGKGSGSGETAGAGAGAAGSTSQTSSGGGNASALNDQGFKLMNQGRYDDAIPLLQKAVAQFPEGSKDLTYAFALYNLGRSLRLAGRPREAVPILEKRLRIPNQTATVRNELEAARRAAG